MSYYENLFTVSSMMPLTWLTRNLSVMPCGEKNWEEACHSRGTVLGTGAKNCFHLAFPSAFYVSWENSWKRHVNVVPPCLTMRQNNFFNLHPKFLSVSCVVWYFFWKYKTNGSPSRNHTLMNIEMRLQTEFDPNVCLLASQLHCEIAYVSNFFVLSAQWRIFSLNS